VIEELKAQKQAAVVNAMTHPENQPEAAPPEAAPKSTLFRTMVISAFAGLIGMAYGVTALSSTLVLGEPASFFSMIPLVAALIVIVTGWVGCMIWMASNEGRTDHEI